MRIIPKPLIAAIMTAVITTVLIVGCKKEHETMLSDNRQIVQDGKRAEAAINRIVHFKKQVDVRNAHLGVKGVDTISISEAVADIVELFNAVYAQPEYFYVQMVRNCFRIDLPLTTDGKVLVDDVVAAYNQAVVLARQAYINDGIDENKGYVGLTVRLGNITDEIAEMVFFSTSGQSGDNNVPNMYPDGPFDADDDWVYRKPLGKCDGTCIGLGADTLLQQMIISVCYDWGRDPVTGQKYYYYDDTIVEFEGRLYQNYLFYRQGTSDQCVQDDEMNSLFYSMKGFLEYAGPAGMGLSLSGSDRYYLKMDFKVEGNHDPMTEGFLSHDIEHAHYARRTLYPSGTIEPGNLLHE